MRDCKYKENCANASMGWCGICIDNERGDTMRRPVDGIMGFVAQTEEGLAKLIEDTFRPEQIIKIERKIERHILMGAYVAKVTYRKEVQNG